MSEISEMSEVSYDQFLHGIIWPYENTDVSEISDNTEITNTSIYEVIEDTVLNFCYSDLNRWLNINTYMKETSIKTYYLCIAQFFGYLPTSIF